MRALNPCEYTEGVLHVEPGQCRQWTDMKIDSHLNIPVILTSSCYNEAVICNYMYSYVICLVSGQ